MGSNRVPYQTSTNRRKGGLAREFAEFFRAIKALADPYRPELHYMRGPGPKWHAKHSPAQDALDTHPALARMKG